MPDLEQGWRPKSAWSVELSDLNLARLGLLTQFEVQIYFGLSIALKGLEQLDLNQWRRLDKLPLEQVVQRAMKAADGLDAALHAKIDEFDTARDAAMPLRHKNVHSLWGHNPELGRANAVFRRTNEHLDVDNFENALSTLAALSFDAKAIAMRVAELIIEGRLKPGNSSKAPRMFVRDTWVQF